MEKSARELFLLSLHRLSTDIFVKVSKNFPKCNQNQLDVLSISIPYSSSIHAPSTVAIYQIFNRLRIQPSFLFACRDSRFCCLILQAYCTWLLSDLKY